MTEARGAILLRGLAVGMLVGTSILGCGGGSKTPASRDAGRGDGGADAAIDAAIDAAVDAPVVPDAAVDVTPDGPPPDVRELFVDAAVGCSEGGTCAAPLSCCNGVCVDTSKDPRHCGACGQTCSATQFCTGTACSETVFANVCTNPNATVIKDQYDPDNNAAAAIGSALTMSCMPPTMVVARDQGEAGVLTASGRPLAGVGNTYLIGGGSFGQRAVDYLDKTDMTPVYLTFDGVTAQFLNRRTGEVLVTTLASALNDGHDFFYLQMFVEPLGGTLCINTIGMYAPGTVAGGFWLSTEIIPKRAMYTDTWYAFEWIDSGDKIPNAADTFRLIAHGR
jgi:stigma-specific protein Stig1